MRSVFSLVVALAGVSHAFAFEGAPDWQFLDAGRYAGNELPWNDQRIPDELQANWAKFDGRIRGEASVDTKVIDGKTLSWFGKELRWQINTEAQVATRMQLLSQHIGVNGDRGPQGRIRVLDSNGRILLSRGMLQKKNEVVYLRMAKGNFVLSDLSGREPETIGKPRFPLTLTFGILVRNPGEECNTRVRIEKDGSLVPVVPELDPNGAPQGILTGLSTRFYVWHGPHSWHVRATSRKYVQFRGVIRILNGGLTYARPVGLERSHIDSWVYRPDSGEIRFVFRCGPSFDGIDFRIAGNEAVVEFDLQTLGKKNPNVVFIGREQKHPQAVPFAFPGKPVVAKK